MNYNYLKKIINNKELFEQTLQKRQNDNNDITYDKLLNLFNKYKDYLSQKQEIEHTLNITTKEIQKNLNNPSRIQELKNKIHQLKNTKDNLAKPDLNIVDYIPNLLQDEVSYGSTDLDNTIITTHAQPPKKTKIKPHYKFDDIQIETACNMSGARFAIFSGEIAKLFRALSSFFLHELKQHGFQEMILPYLVLDKAMYNTGNLPKFDEDSFKSDKYRLIPTAEVALVNMFENKTFDKKFDKVRVCAFTPCFRSEVGSAGLDTQGIKRLHQFHKVEMVSITRNDNSHDEHQDMLKIEESILQKLGLHYRVVRLCSGDTGFHSSKTYDIEVFMPSTQKYMEISSCSNCLDFQSIRSNIKYKTEDTKEYAHTLNGSAFPIERLIAAIVENCQLEDGSIAIPEVLKQYMN